MSEGVKVAGMADASEMMNEANGDLADWVQTLPPPLIIPGCDIHAKVQDAMKAAQAEIWRLSKENERLWRARNHAITKVRGWEDVIVAEGLPFRAVRVEEWGPGEGEQVAVPEVTPTKLTAILDELHDLRRRKMRT